MTTMVRKAAAVVGMAAVVILAGGLLSGTLALVSTTGTSMAPRIEAGDLVIVRRASYEVGDAVAYRSPELRQVVLHRVIAREGERYVFQGDNNDFIDPERLTQAAIIGQEWLHIPDGGLWLRRAASPPVLAAVAFLLISGTGAGVRGQRRRKRDTSVTIQLESPSATPAIARRLRPLTDRFAALPPWLRRTAAGIAVLGVLSAALGALAWSRPLHTAATAPQAVEATVDFTYTAQMDPSAGSSAEVVTAPAQVFWPLAPNVDVGFRYAGPPGSVTVDAVLAAPSGWQTTVRLADAVRVTGPTHDGSVVLDLVSLQGVVNAAAAAGHHTANEVTLDVVPRVALDGGGEIAARLALRLDLLHLTFVGVGDASASLDAARGGSLTAAISTTSSGQRPATLAVLGRKVGVATARTASLFGVALALLAAAAFVAVAKRTDPLAESEQIAARYARLLLPVLPIALPPTRPVVDVASIAVLAALAERFGLPVLHWSRSGVDTYIVQDEATSYRYRAGAATGKVERVWSTELSDAGVVDANSEVG